MYNVLDVAKLIINYGNTLGYGITYRKLCYLLFIISTMFNEIIRKPEEKNLFKDKVKFKNDFPEIKAVKKAWSEIESELPIEARFDDSVIKEEHADPIYYSIKRFGNHTEEDLEDVAINMAIKYGYVKAPIEEVVEETEQTAEVLIEEGENSELPIADEKNVEVIVGPEKPIEVDEKHIETEDSEETINAENVVSNDESPKTTDNIEQKNDLTIEENEQKNDDDFRGKVIPKRSKKHRKKKKRSRK